MRCESNNQINLSERLAEAESSLFRQKFERGARRRVLVPIGVLALF